MTAQEDARLERIGREECLRLLAGEQIGRVGVVAGRVAHVVPVNYVLDGEAVVFRTSVGTKLYGATHGPVTVEVDQIDPLTCSGWSVVVRGIAHEVTDADEVGFRERLWSLTVEPWAPGDRPYYLRVPAELVTGRRVVPATQ